MQSMHTLALSSGSASPSSPLVESIQRLEAKLRVAQEGHNAQEGHRSPRAHALAGPAGGLAQGWEGAPRATGGDPDPLSPLLVADATNAFAADALEEASVLRHQVQRDLEMRSQAQAREAEGLAIRVSELDSSLRATEAARRREVAARDDELREVRERLAEAERRRKTEVVGADVAARPAGVHSSSILAPYGRYGVALLAELEGSGLLGSMPHVTIDVVRACIAFFRAFDSDADGSLSSREFIDGLKAYGRAMGSADALNKKVLREAFASADASSDAQVPPPSTPPPRPPPPHTHTPSLAPPPTPALSLTSAPSAAASPAA